MESLFIPFQVFQVMPATALLPGLLLAALLTVGNHDKSQRPTRLVVSSIMLWIAYAAWEYRVQIWAETESAPIRVDLLLIAPLLIVATTWSCVAIYKWRNSAP